MQQNDYDIEIVDEEEQQEQGVFLREEQEQELLAIINRELPTIEEERSERLRRKRQQRMLLAGRPNEELPDSRNAPQQKPFSNAARVSVPLIPMIVQTMYAQLVSTFNRDPMWTFSAFQTDNEKHLKQAEVLTKYLNMLAENQSDLNMRRVLRDAFMESAPMGECFYKVIYDRDTVHYQTDELEQEVVLHDGPSVMVVDYEHLLFRDTWGSMAKLPLIAHVIPMSEETFKMRVAQGLYNNEEAVLRASREYANEDEQNRARTEDVRAGDVKRIDIYEIYLYYDIDGDGHLEDLQLFYHRESNCFVRTGYNTFGVRPFIPARHVHRTNRITGIGVCELLEYPAIEMNSIHNLFLDNVKLANSMVLTKRATALNKGKDIEIRAGGATVLSVEEHDDIRVFRFGEIYPSLLEAMDRVFQFAMRVTGVNEALAGFPSSQLGSRDTAAGQQQRLTQGSSILATIAQGHEEAISEVGRLIYMRLVRQREHVVRMEQERKRLTEEELELLSEALAVQSDEMPSRAVFRVKTSDADQTFESRRNNNFALSTMYQQYIQSIVEMIGTLFGPESRQTLQQAPKLYLHMAQLFIGQTKLMEENFEFFGKQNEHEYLPSYEALQVQVQQMKEALSAIPTATAGPAGPAGMVGGPPTRQTGAGGGMPGTDGESLLEPAGGPIGAPGPPVG